jgi:hypothetical protein
MFEAAEPEVFQWNIKNYGPEVNLFVDHSQIVELEASRSGIWGTKSLWGRVADLQIMRPLRPLGLKLLIGFHNNDTRVIKDPSSPFVDACRWNRNGSNSDSVYHSTWRVWRLVRDSSKVKT